MTLGCGSFLGFLFMKGGDPDLFKKVCIASDYWETCSCAKMATMNWGRTWSYPN